MASTILQTSRSCDDLTLKNKSEGPKSSAWLRVNNPSELEARRNTGSGFAIGSKAAFLEDQNKAENLKRWRHRPTQHDSGDSSEDLPVESTHSHSFDGFVDARYVFKWLDGISSDFVPSGIGDPNGSFERIGEASPAHNHGILHAWHSMSSLRQFTRREVLEEDFKHLVDDYRRLVSRIAKANLKLNRLFGPKRKVGLGGGLVEKSRNPDGQTSAPDDLKLLRQRATCNANVEQLNDERNSILEKLDKLNSSHSSKVAELEETNKKLTAQAARKCLEVEELRSRHQQLVSLCEIHCFAEAFKLERENSIFRDGVDLSQIQLEFAGGRLARLIDGWESLCIDEGQLEAENAANKVGMEAELHKLRSEIELMEKVLGAESEIKTNLERRLQEISAEKEALRQDLLAVQETRETELLRGDENHQIDRLGSEVDVLTRKAETLAKDKQQLGVEHREVVLQTLELETNHLNSLDTLSRQHSEELVATKKNLVRAEAERTNLWQRIRMLNDELRREEAEKLELRNELSEMKSGLRFEAASQALKVKRLRAERERKIKHHQAQLDLVSGESRKLGAQIEAKKSELHLVDQQVGRLKSRFEPMRAEFLWRNEKRDGELTRLRSELNLEQHDRQIMRLRIEKELQSSLQKIESMRNHFARRAVCDELSARLLPDVA